uniref:NADH-ubiquinone oxidoreductase chain 3 n=1 Tax=Calophya schini TaxID=121824 RepID=A0A343LDR5_9HEMI|nr:NADH dehydrogenase subunit 3 [Calophya schini]
MMLLSYVMFTIIVVIMIIMNILPMVSIHKKKDREKMSPFECGFDIMSKTRNAFSIHFFTTMLMFLIFDIEITLMMPLPLVKKSMMFTGWSLMIVMLTTILLIGLFMEWKEGSMNWN